MYLRKKVFSSGFTLIELLLVMGIFAILVAISTVVLLQPQATASYTSVKDQLVSDLKSQQLKSVNGTGNGSSSSAHGMYFASNQYVLFDGASYNSQDPNNFVVNLPSGVVVSTTLPNSQIIFSQLSGEVANYVSGKNTIAVYSASKPQASPSPLLPNDDTDGDGFTNFVEQYVGTDPLKPCGVNAWPPDFNNDGAVNIIDVSLFNSHYGTIKGQAGYDPRYDLDADGAINIIDLSILNKWYGKFCSSFPTPPLTLPGNSVYTLTINNFGIISGY